MFALPEINASAYYKTGTVANVEYTISGSHLIISGNGSMGNSSSWPWGRDITELTILDGVTSISGTAFAECKYLSFVELPNSLKVIENNAFYGCESLGFIDIPSSVSKIGGSAFADCYNLSRIVLPRELTELSAGIFDGCISLEYIDVDEGNKKFCSIDGVLFSSDKKTLLRYPMGRYDEYYAIPSGVEIIEENAFGGASNLKNVDIPQSVTKIGRNAFKGTEFFDYYASNTYGVYKIGHCAITANGDFGSIFTDGYSVIADGAFEYCDGLTGMLITSEITRIGKATFYGCENLKEVAFSTSIKTIEMNAFKDCDALTTVYFGGTPTEAQKIKIESGNNALKSAKWYYNRCGYMDEHSWLIDYRVEATCTKNGKLVEKCQSCNKTRSESIPITNHTWKMKITKKATCKSAGLKQKTCTSCNKTENEVISALGHEFEKNTLDGRISCKQAGVIKCRRCSALAEGNEALISHKYTAWKETKAPDCTLDGKEERSCTDCGKKQTRTISPTGHLFDDSAVKKEATLYSEGLVQGKCKRCEQEVKQTLPCTYQNEKLGIKIEAAEGVFKKGTEISVIKVDDNSPLIPQIDGLPERFTAYNITAKNGSKTVEPNGKFKIIINIPKDFSGDAEIYSLSLTDATEVKSSVSSDKKTVAAELSKFGSYAICDFSEVADVGGEKQSDKTVLFEIDSELIFKMCTVALAIVCLALIITLIIVLAVKRKAKSK